MVKEKRLITTAEMKGENIGRGSRMTTEK